MFCRRSPFKIDILAIAFIFLLATGCNAGSNPLTPIPSTSTPTPTAGFENSSTFIGPQGEVTPTATAVPIGNLSVFQPNFLSDPDAACFINHIDWTLTGNPLANDDNAFSCLDKRGWHVYAPGTFTEPLPAPRWIGQCPDGRIYLDVVLNNSHKFYRLKGETLTVLPSLDISVDSLACGPGSEIWVIYSGGVGHYNGTYWTVYAAEQYLGTGEFVGLVNSIAMAPDGSVWVATGSSIATFDGTSWRVFETGKGFEEKPILYSLDIDSTGNVWVANNHGLMSYDGSQWSTYYEGLPNRFEYYSKTIRVDAENRIWMAREYPAAVYLYDPQAKSWVTKISEDALKVNLIKAMQLDRQGRLWFVTDYGLDVYDGSVLTSYHMHTADLYANTADALIVLGDGPRLPALEQKAPGSVHGKVIGPDPAKYTGRQVETCIKAAGIMFYGKTPCGDQAFHVLSTIQADGNFEFTDVPVGKYYLMIQAPSNSWRGTGLFEVKPGTRTELGGIELPSN